MFFRYLLFSLDQMKLKNEIELHQEIKLFVSSFS